MDIFPQLLLHLKFFEVVSIGPTYSGMPIDGLHNGKNVRCLLGDLN